MFEDQVFILINNFRRDFAFWQAMSDCQDFTKIPTCDNSVARTYRYFLFAGETGMRFDATVDALCRYEVKITSHASKPYIAGTHPLHPPTDNQPSFRSSALDYLDLDSWF